MNAVMFLGSVLRIMLAAPIVHRLNSVRYSISLMPGQRLPGVVTSHPAPPVIKKSGSFHREGRPCAAALPRTWMTSAKLPQLSWWSGPMRHELPSRAHHSANSSAAWPVEYWQ